MADLQSQWCNLGFQRALPVLHLLEMPNTTQERGRYKTECSNTLLKAVNCILSNYKEEDFSWKPTLYHNLRKHPAVGCSPLMLPEWSVLCLNQKNFINTASSLTTVGNHCLKTLNSDWTFPRLVDFSILEVRTSLFLFEHIFQFLFHLPLTTIFFASKKPAWIFWIIKFTDQKNQQ